MKVILLAFAIAAGLGLGLQVQAQTSNSVTLTCKDGTSYTGVRRGACRGHGGVPAESSAEAKPAAAQPAVAPPPSAPMKSAASPTPSAPVKSAAIPPAPAPTKRTPAPLAQAVAGGGPGQVWVNSGSKVYHCQGDRYYGRTKAGAYMTEAAAKAQGDRPVGGKACP